MSDPMGGRLLAGRYRLDAPLGSGGMAQVYAGVDETLGRRIAVKLLHAAKAHDPLLRERLLREARAAASFSHPHAVAVYDVGEDAGTPFIVMELVEGQTLADVVRAQGALDPDMALRIVGDVLAALGAAHREGLVHRDVKPANVLLPADGGGAKLADFGIAKGLRDAGAGLTMTGEVVGTARYLSPEQVSGQQATPRSDLYAVGVLCYELLAGRPPFEGEHALSVALAHQRDVAAPLTTHRPDLPAGVAAAVGRAMEKSPADRFADAEEMREALLRDRTPGPAAAATTQVLRSPGPARRSRTPMVRTAVIAAAVLLALVGAGLALSDRDERAVVAPTPTGEPAAPSPEPAAGEAAPEPEPEPEPEVQAEPEPAPVPDPEQGPSSPQALLRMLERDPAAAGEKGDDLREKLGDLLGEKPKDQPKKARELIKDTGKWAEKGELDRDVAATVAVLLQPMASGEEQEGGGPPERDDDEDEDEGEDDD